MLSDGGIVIVIVGVIALIVAGTVARGVLVRRVRRRLGGSVGGAGESASVAAPPPGLPGVHPLNGIGVQVIGDPSAITAAQRDTLRALGVQIPAQGSSTQGAKRSLLDEMERLTALRDTGVLTTEEFEKQKRRVLEREP